MEVAFLVGRIVVGIYYLYNAWHHFYGVEGMTGYAQSKGVPSPRLAVLAAGVLLLVGGLCFLTGYQPTIGVVAVVLFLLPVTYQMHAFWKEEDPMMKAIQRVNFTKNLGLLGSTLMFLAIPQPWPYSLGY